MCPDVYREKSAAIPHLTVGPYAMKNLFRTSGLCAVTALGMTSPSFAQDSAEASSAVSLSSESGADSSADASANDSAPATEEEAWIDRYPAENMLFELGIFGGLLFPSGDHNLQDEQRVQVPFSDVAPDFGLRAAFLPLSFFGVEAEGALMPTSSTDGASALLYAVRGHGILQLPMWSIQPFLLVGGGILGADNSSNGDDADPAFHFGGGVKINMTELWMLRLDVRDTLTQKNVTGFNNQVNAEGEQVHHPEVLLGLSIVLGRDEKAPPPDADKDGISDAQDKCPQEAGPAPDGCPPPPDTDGDGVLDSEDKCPTEAGPAPEGCPPPPDTDGDGVLDAQDKCPTEAGPAPEGCPDRDADKDGVLDPDDKCPAEPETKNGYQDVDGCPDEVPAAVQKFTGVIKGIEFDFGKTTIRRGSQPLLDEAAKVLIEHPDLRVEISGHTDNVGSAERNKEISLARAEAVKNYLVLKGVEESRIVARGAGLEEPIDSNDTAAGRQKNRRIEFKLIQ